MEAKADVTTKSDAELIDYILSFWYPSDPNVNRGNLWFSPGEAMDQKMKDNFGPLLDEIKKNENKYSHWKESGKGKLAYVILTDQLPRNIYRGTAEAFAFDHLAIPIAIDYARQLKDTVAKGEAEKVKHFMAQYKREEWTFFFLPLTHAEDVEVSRLAVETFQVMKEHFQDNPSTHAHKLALKHFKIVEQFGHYPHRNKVLGREAKSEEERVYLKDPDRFGQ